MGWLTFSMQAGFFLGPTVAGLLIAVFDIRTVIAVTTAVLLFAITGRARRHGHEADAERVDLITQLRALSAQRAFVPVVTGLVAATLVWGTVGAFLPIFGREALALPSSQVGFLFALQAVANGLARIPGGRIVDWAQHRWPIVFVGTIVWSIATIVLGHLHGFVAPAIVMIVATPFMATAFVAIGVVFGNLSAASTRGGDDGRVRDGALPLPGRRTAAVRSDHPGQRLRRRVHRLRRRVDRADARDGGDARRAAAPARGASAASPLHQGPDEVTEDLPVAGERQLREVVKREDMQLEHLLARRQAPAVDDPPAIADSDHARGLSLGDVIDPDEARDLNLGTDLLEAFASGRVERALVVVDESAGQAPVTKRRLDRAPAEHDATVRLDNTAVTTLGSRQSTKSSLGQPSSMRPSTSRGTSAAPQFTQ